METTTQQQQDRPRVEWERDVKIAARQVERDDGITMKLEARLSRLPLSRPRYRVVLGAIGSDDQFHPGLTLPIQIDRGEVCAPSIASAVYEAVCEVEAWALQDAQDREQDRGAKRSGTRGIGGAGKTARDKAKKKDPANKTNNPALSAKRGRA